MIKALESFNHKFSTIDLVTQGKGVRNGQVSYQHDMTLKFKLLGMEKLVIITQEMYCEIFHCKQIKNHNGTCPFTCLKFCD